MTGKRARWMLLTGVFKEEWGWKSLSGRSTFAVALTMSTNLSLLPGASSAFIVGSRSCCNECIVCFRYITVYLIPPLWERQAEYGEGMMNGIDFRQPKGEHVQFVAEDFGGTQGK